MVSPVAVAAVRSPATPLDGFCVVRVPVQHKNRLGELRGYETAARLGKEVLEDIAHWTSRRFENTNCQQ